MIVIADTTPLNHLILVDQADLLQALYGRVIIPQAVLSELQAYATPPGVKAWVCKRPDWLEVNHSAEQLRGTGFRASPQLIQFFLDRHTKAKYGSRET